MQNAIARQFTTTETSNAMVNIAELLKRLLPQKWVKAAEASQTQNRKRYGDDDWQPKTLGLLGPSSYPPF